MIQKKTAEDWAKYLLQQRWTKALLMVDDPFHLYVDVITKAMDQAFESGKLHERHQTKVIPAIEKIKEEAAKEARIKTLRECREIVNRCFGYSAAEHEIEKLLEQE